MSRKKPVVEEEEAAEEVAQEAEETTSEMKSPLFLPGSTVIVQKSEEDKTPILIGVVAVIEVIKDKGTGGYEYRYHLNDPRIKSMVQGYPESYLSAFA